MQQLWDLIARNAVKVARTFWTTFLREWHTHIFICIRFYQWVSYRTDDNRNNGYLFCEKKHRIPEDPLFLLTGVTVQTRSKKYNLSFSISFFDRHIISIFLIFTISNFSELIIIIIFYNHNYFLDILHKYSSINIQILPYN